MLDAQKALEDFRRAQTLSAEEGEKLEQLAQMEAAQDELKRSSDAFTERVQQLSAKLQLVGRQIGDMEAKQRTLDDALRRRQLLPADLPFGTPFMDPVDDSMDNLLPLLNDYQDSWQGLLRADGQIEALYAQVRLKGVAKFDSEDDVERRLQLLINAYAHRTDEALTLGKARRAAVTDIARTLRNIRSDYDSLEHQLALVQPRDQQAPGVQPAELPHRAGAEQGSAQAYRPDHPQRRSVRRRRNPVGVRPEPERRAGQQERRGQGIPGAPGGGQPQPVGPQGLCSSWRSRSPRCMASR